MPRMRLGKNAVFPFSSWAWQSEQGWTTYSLLHVRRSNAHSSRRSKVLSTLHWWLQWIARNFLLEAEIRVLKKFRQHSSKRNWTCGAHTQNRQWRRIHESFFQSLAFWYSCKDLMVHIPFTWTKCINSTACAISHLYSHCMKTGAVGSLIFLILGCLVLLPSYIFRKLRDANWNRN